MEGRGREGRGGEGRGVREAFVGFVFVLGDPHYFFPFPRKKLKLPFVGGTGWLLHCWQPKHVSPVVPVLFDRGTIIPVC